MNYYLYLITRLNSLKTLLDLLNEDEKKKEILLAQINGIRNPIHEILDFTINHFPKYKGWNSGLYFPILNPDQTIEDLKQNKYFNKCIKTIEGDIESYLYSAYKIILDDKYDQCLLLLTGLTKHRNEDLILNKKGHIEYEISGNEDLIEQNIYGDTSVGNLVKSTGGGKLTMENCVIETPMGTTVIKKLVSGEIDGNSLMIKKGDKNIKVFIKLFLEKCIKCSEEIVELWNTYSK